MNRQVGTAIALPHDGTLCRDGELPNISYMIDVTTGRGTIHTLVFDQHAFDFSRRIFAFLDTESTGCISKASVETFVTLRCPVFWKRDEDLRKVKQALSPNSENTAIKRTTFEEIWNAVVVSDASFSHSSDQGSFQCLGLEAWMIFCRFIALAQYFEAKRRFSVSHLQQTMKHRNAPRGSEMVVVDLPPEEPPAALTADALADYERQSEQPLPLPELDLDHSLLAAHDMFHQDIFHQPGHVKLALFGSQRATSAGQSSDGLEFALTYVPPEHEESIVVRRCMKDMQWLHETFADHTKLGGTLSGRILPPFPVQERNGIVSSITKDDTVLKSSLKSTSGAIASAVKGVGKIKDAAKSLIGSYISQQDTNDGEDGGSVRLAKRVPSGQKGKRLSMPSNYYNPELPVGKARQIERYLNYLLEHPALAASFPLNAILTASQSGLEAAKDALEDCRKSKKDFDANTPQLQDGVMSHTSLSNFGWVRTAAQAAMALKIHGMLETTGMQSASAMLQQASLPPFETLPEDRDRDEPSKTKSTNIIPNDLKHPHKNEEDFESGVIKVESELKKNGIEEDDDYDLLPLPVPAPERRILNAGNLQSSEISNGSDRFHYGTGYVEGQLIDPDFDDTFSVFLGEVNVDENIDKLREVIGSVDNTLSRCRMSSGSIGKAQKERLDMHLQIIRNLDSWGGMRGKFVSQRPLMKGLDGIEHSKEVYEESNLALVDDLSWQTSLANAAVEAAESVRCAVRISRTAANARASASSAAMSAEHACAREFTSMDEARAAQTRASIAKSHALRAAVVEHEAKTVKRRATLALANDVKCWNIHRKREILRSCLSYARSQHEATRRAFDAWSSLRDGFIGSSAIPSFEKRAFNRSPAKENSTGQEEATARLFDELFSREEHPSASLSENDLFSSVVGSAKVGDEFEDTISDAPFAFADPMPLEASRSSIHSLASEMKDQMTRSGVIGGEDAREDIMTASMQSLVEGLMTWGGAFDEEDHFALPAGMAASIAFESGTKFA